MNKNSGYCLPMTVNKRYRFNHPLIAYGYTPIYTEEISFKQNYGGNKTCESPLTEKKVILF